MESLFQAEYPWDIIGQLQNVSLPLLAYVFNDVMVREL